MSLDRAAEVVKFLPFGSMKLELFEHFCGLFNLYANEQLRKKFIVDCGYKVPG
jgi:hypothetical protein